MKCSGAKRKEIGRQLLADIQAELDQGLSLEVIILRMGEPIAIAEEFNQNLSEQEHRSYRKGFLVKLTAGIAAVIVLACLAAVWYLPMGLRFGSSGLYTQADVEARKRRK